MRVGVRLGIDVGRARIGVAMCDRYGTIATPMETVARDHTNSGADIDRIVALAREHEVIELVVGLPISMSGNRTASTDDAEGFARLLAQKSTDMEQHVSVRLVDERLSTVSAQNHLRAAGKKSKQSRGIIDQAAAVVILQHALDSERVRGDLPGTVITIHTTHTANDNATTIHGDEA